MDTSTAGPGRSRKIIHVDMDAFYASVEVRERPELAGRPVVVGGSPQSRGVVAAASYEARRYGIHSAMPSARAYAACPHAVFLRPDFEKYRAVSAQIRGILHRFTDLVEPLSLDEAYLDVTENKVGEPSATRIARAIKAAIRAETGLTASAGVAPNKFLAKVASDEDKPDGLCVIPPEEVAAFLERLPLKKVPGIGPATAEAFARLGVTTCGALQRLAPGELERHFGKRGGYFYRLARGADDRPVEAHRPRKSVGVEDTFATDHAEAAWLQDKVAALADTLAGRLQRAEARGRTVTLKARFADFRTITRSRTLAAPVQDAGALAGVAGALLRQHVPPGAALRLLGISVSNLERPGAPSAGHGQLSFAWAEEPPAVPHAHPHRGAP